MVRYPRIGVIACETGDTAHRSKALYGTAFNDHPRSSTGGTLPHTTAASSNPTQTEVLAPIPRRQSYRIPALASHERHPELQIPHGRPASQP
ncbi:hypothetical protein V501_07240 [Pseudogymnoascus sp. VKM F-4519 (FW-2642)]|nr:hypothetical protein V501_07240 [Pseudogymnoascus sp. VKM F-4519 (FW-2642)]